LQCVGVKGLGRHVVERTLLVAVCCSVLQCVAVRWDTLWGTYTVCAYLHVAYMLCYLTWRTCAYLQTTLHTCAFLHTTHIYEFIYTHLSRNMNSYMYIRLQVCTDALSADMVCMYVYMYVHTCTRRKNTNSYVWWIRIHVYDEYEFIDMMNTNSYIHPSPGIWIHIYICLQVCTDALSADMVCMYVYMYVYTCVCM